jgi:hypothetical protein
MSCSAWHNQAQILVAQFTHISWYDVVESVSSNSNKTELDEATDTAQIDDANCVQMGAITSLAIEAPARLVRYRRVPHH